MSRKAKKVKATSILPMAAAGGLFIGLGLGALMGAALVATVVGVVAGCALGYSIDRRNGVSYGRKSH